MTKKQQGMLSYYEMVIRKGAKTSLQQVYKTCSTRKQQAFRYCLDLQKRLNGYSGTIVGASSHFFSYAFKYFDGDLKKECLCYCTHANDYKFVIED